MYLSAKVKMLEHASDIVKGIFHISKIILPNPEILCFYIIMFYRVENGVAAIFFVFSFETDTWMFPFAGKGSSSNGKGWELHL